MLLSCYVFVKNITAWGRDMVVLEEVLCDWQIDTEK